MEDDHKIESEKNGENKDTVEDEKEEFPLGAVFGGVAAAAGLYFLGKKILKPKNESKIPSSLNNFAKELVGGGKSFSAVVEANNPLSNELTKEDVDEIAKAVSKEVMNKIKKDPDFRVIVREEAASIKRTLPGNMLASAVVNGITFALGAI